jgi:cytidylate kinase
MAASNSPPVITVDGASGTGKGTLSLLLSQHLGWHFLDSGAIYRALAYAADRRAISIQHINEIVKLSQDMNIDFDSHIAEIWIDGVDATQLIRTEYIGDLASQLSMHKSIREALLDKQRSFLQWPGLVADGRDMGTVVFPHASYKIFLTASIHVRAERRQKQLMEQGINVNLAELVNDMNQRDERDQLREVSPLRPAKGAVIMCTENRTPHQLVDEIVSLLKTKGAALEKLAHT